MNGSSGSTIPYFETPVVTLSTSAIQYTTSLDYVPTYEWTIPAGWVWVDAGPADQPANQTAGSGTDKRVFALDFAGGIITSSVRVRPPLYTPGTVKVRALNTPPCGVGAPSNYSTLTITRPRPEIRLPSAAQTITCGRGITPTATALLTMPVPAGYTVSYTWSIVSQQVQPPAPAGAAMLQTFSTSAMTSGNGVLNGLATTGNPGTASLKCVATIAGPGGYTSTSSNFVVTVSNTLVTPVITSSSTVALCTPTDTRLLTATAPGASQMQWWTEDGSLEFTTSPLAATPVWKRSRMVSGALTDAFTLVTSGTNGTSNVLVRAWAGSMMCSPFFGQ